VPHHLGPNREVTIVSRKVFEDFDRCADSRAWEAACLDQPNDSWREVCVSEPSEDSDEEYLRQWLLRNGATEDDQYVFLAICW
jgi:hypothetical protein